MDDIATIGVRADTSDLARGGVALDTFAARGEQTERRIHRSAAIMSGGMRNVATAAIGMASAIVSFQTANVAIAAARGFNAALAETSTLIAGNVAEMQQIEEGARAMSRQFGGSATAQVQAYYQAISAGAGNAAQATALLDQANRLAIGGVTDVTTAVDVLTSATNAYRASGLTAAEASDALFVGMRAGKTTITELSASVGQVLPVATALGVSFDETVAAMSALTKSGMATAQAATGVRAALTSMIAPTDQARKLAAELGIEFSAAGVEAHGFGGIMDQVMAATGGNAEMVRELFGSIEATTAALSFAGGAGVFFNEIMDEMADKAGSTTEAFDLVAESLDQRLNRVLSQGGDLLLGVGNAMLTGLVPAAESAIQFVNFISDNLDTLGVIAVGLASTQIPALVIALASKGAALIATASAAGILSGAMGVLGSAVAIAGGPLGLFLGIAGGLTAAMILFRDTTDTVPPIMDSATDAVNRINEVLATSSESALPAAARETLNLTNRNIQLAQSAYAAAEAEAAKARAFADIAMTDLMLQQAFSPTGEHTQAIADHQLAINRLTLAEGDLAAAQATLTDRINEGQLALTNATGEMAENQRRAIDLTVTMDDLGGAIAGVGSSGDGGAAEAARKLAEEARKAAEELKKMQNEMQQGAGQAADFFMSLVGGANSAGRAFEQLGMRLIRSGITNFITGQATANPGGFFGTIAGLFGGFRAEGGPVSSGRSYVVGERGPELFTPGASGMITPNHAMRGGMGGGGTVTVFVQAEEGAMFRPTVRAEAQGVAVQVVQQYDRTMPDRVQSIQSDPRARA